MRVNIIGFCNVLQLNRAISGDVQLIISLSYDSFTSLIQLSTKSANELIEVYLAVSVAIKVLKDLHSLLFGQLKAEVHQTPSEIIKVKFSIVILVHCFENS